MHGSGSSGTKVLCTIVGCLLCWASIGPDVSKIATEIRIALMLRLLQPYYGIAASVRPLIKYFHKRPWLAGRVAGNKTLTRIRMPNHRLAFTPRGRGGWAFHGTVGVCSQFFSVQFLPLSSTNRFLSTPSGIIRIIH